MSEPWLVALRGQYQEIESRLEEALPGQAPPSKEAREAVKRDIIALFKRVDSALTELGQLKEEIRTLVERYKRLNATDAEGPAPLSPAPQFTGARPVVQADHLGASTFIEKGWSLISLGDHVGAIQSLEKALTLSPGAVQAQSLLGWAQMLHEDYDDALGTFSKVLMKEPANALARINVGYICLKKRIFGEAIEHLSKAIRLDNDRKATLYAHYYLGLVYLEREMYEDAQTFFRKTIKLGPNLIEAHFELGRALWLAGQKDEALQTWAEGHKANKFNPWAKRCKEMLDLTATGGEVPRSPLT
ncbi:MAG: tetratricopeptide repeat protein [Gemmatimonadales bacterium]